MASSSIEAFPTPLLSVDLPTVRNNLRSMADYTAEHNLRLRPHIKTHKSRLFSQLQLEYGAVGLTSAKPSEAIAAATDAEDILLAYPCFTSPRMQLLETLCKDRQIRMGIDSPQAAERISNYLRDQSGSTIGLLVDLDVGHHRTGVGVPESVVNLARQIESLPNVRFDGVMFFPGHVVPNHDGVGEGMANVRAELVRILDALENAGLKPTIVSGGSTPTAKHTHLIPEISEIRPGTYIFNDLNSVRWQCATLDDCAALVHATVISTAVKGKAVIDAGSKMLSSDPCGADPQSGFGLLVDHPGAKVARLSEEHGEIELGESDWSPQIGDRVRILPNHICPCVNLQNELILVDRDQPPRRLAIDARGMVH
ncbi:alanine racemase domain-containing protein [Rhodopirellula maiorica SM1]|uniref:Alanine racemase domain-containing protein n=1 Tax=Rhodopirellula maiorica SM1 TaxID=1265738 RepID=M5RNH0_9BACT|nr:alanine racemase [Rhodopirellula maiorica]EMI20835.1 alanine racemase domain-containing protein [Rhodopirellula maiorica SM1]